MPRCGGLPRPRRLRPAFRVGVGTSAPSQAARVERREHDALEQASNPVRSALAGQTPARGNVCRQVAQARWYVRIERAKCSDGRVEYLLLASSERKLEVLAKHGGHEPGGHDFEPAKQQPMRRSWRREQKSPELE